MQEVGVTAVVEGLSSFMSDINKMEGGIKSLMPSGNALTAIFQGVTGALSALGREILNVAEYALGKLLADAIEWVIGKIKDLISETIQAGAEFQTLSLRLNRLNFNEVADSAKNFSEGMATATKMTQEQLLWLQKLAVTTPYDAQDIANVFTLARSYGFAADAAKGLTEDISDFAAGMGLGNTEIERIIVNFGQMVQQGKVTQREMNDLARGAFVPVNDILAEMQKETGLTGAAFDDFRKTGEGVQAFFTAFSTLVKDRFGGAAEAMARTFKGATDNAKDLLKSLIGFNVVRPILDILGGKVADFIDALTAGGNFEKMNTAAKALGESISKLVESLLSLFGIKPTPIWDNLELNDVDKIKEFSSLGEKVVKGLEKITDWVNKHRGDIVGFFQGVKDKIKEIWNTLKNRDFKGFLEALGLSPEIIGKITMLKDDILKVFDKVKGWVNDNGPLIKKFFETLGEIVGKVFDNLFGNVDTGGLDGLLEGVKNFMQYVIDNKDQIAEFVTNLIEAWVWFQKIGFVLGVLMGIVLAILAPLFAFLGVITGIVAIIALLFSPIGLLIGLLAVLAYMWLTNKDAVLIAVDYIQAKWAELWANFAIGVAYAKAVFVQWWTDLVSTYTTFMGMIVEGVSAGFQNMFVAIAGKLLEIVIFIREKIDAIKALFRDTNWGTLGRGIIEGIMQGVIHSVQYLIDAVVGAIEAAIEAAKEALGMQSPSKVFANIGKLSMQGLSNGITESIGMVQKTMENAVGAIVAPAMNLPAITQQLAVSAAPSVNNTTSLTNNFNMTVNTNSPKEPIMQDYAMMQAMVG